MNDQVSFGSQPQYRPQAASAQMAPQMMARVQIGNANAWIRNASRSSVSAAGMRSPTGYGKRRLPQSYPARPASRRRPAGPELAGSELAGSELAGSAAPAPSEPRPPPVHVKPPGPPPRAGRTRTPPRTRPSPPGTPGSSPPATDSTALPS